MKNFKHFRKLFLVILTLATLVSLPTEATIISDGSAGIFHPSKNTILDLTGPDFPQFSDVQIDAGITVKVLSGTPDSPARFLAQNNFLLNGVIDAINSLLTIAAGNSIVLGSNSQINAGSLSLYINQGSINSLTGKFPVRPPAGGSVSLWGNINLSSRGDLSLLQSPDSTNVLNPIFGGSIALTSGGGISNSNRLSGGILTVSQPFLNIPEPKTLFLFSIGLFLLTYRRKWSA
ncbi:PEP-CTERM sorting domain-containing protein [Sulfurirhabdus autotrophica]|uniref:Putative secreted protein with PEP-CTERM sorting signal n=1 Tax=Sulfurirhabdus autotrophica TaxID=1706046 RepID=A0A4R3YCI2_9PROT|nr:PEP-CTERM sorting domain-containing protein [Sulfurirhabdus autotrophica]TCV89541.1 putative secreted protein with PEP-CTERM sorting signal [Sulfurirhabdus autotrophica]